MSEKKRKPKKKFIKYRGDQTRDKKKEVKQTMTIADLLKAKENQTS